MLLLFMAVMPCGTLVAKYAMRRLPRSLTVMISCVSVFSRPGLETLFFYEREQTVAFIFSAPLPSWLQTALTCQRYVEVSMDERQTSGVGIKGHIVSPDASWHGLDREGMEHRRQAFVCF